MEVDVSPTLLYNSVMLLSDSQRFGITQVNVASFLLLIVCFVLLLLCMTLTKQDSSETQTAFYVHVSLTTMESDDQ